MEPVAFWITAESDVAEGLDGRAQRVETRGQVLVAAVDDVDVAQDRGARSREHRHQDDHCWTKCRRADDRGSAPARGPGDQHPMWVKQLNLDADLGELGQIDGTVVVDPVVD